MSNIRETIRGLIQESILIEEDKRAMLKKVPGIGKASIEHLLALFKEKPHLEKKIDWNNYKRLTWEDDFLPLFELGSMGNEFKKLKKNQDYVEVLDDDLNTVPGLLGVYMPLNYNAAHVLTKKAGGTKAQWCIGYDGDDSYWYGYSYGAELREYGNFSYGDGESSVFYIFIFNNDKYAVQVQASTPGHSTIIWDKKDNNHGDANDIVPGVDIKKFVSSKSKLTQAVYDELIKISNYDDRYIEIVDEIESKKASLQEGEELTVTGEEFEEYRQICPPNYNLKYEFIIKGAYYKFTVDQVYDKYGGAGEQVYSLTVDAPVIVNYDDINGFSGGKMGEIKTPQYLLNKIEEYENIIQERFEEYDKPKDHPMNAHLWEDIEEYKDAYEKVKDFELAYISSDNQVNPVKVGDVIITTHDTFFMYGDKYERIWMKITNISKNGIEGNIDYSIQQDSQPFDFVFEL
jgi:hypothetical protein